VGNKIIFTDQQREKVLKSKSNGNPPHSTNEDGLHGFDEENLQKIFGHEAAEDEDPARLKEYYFKGDAYAKVVNDLPLRILVGHKGIGKSALFQVAMAEENEKNRLNVMIKPDDILGIADGSNDDFLMVIREWKKGINEIIARKVLNTFGMQQDNMQAKLMQFGGKTLDFLQSTFKAADRINLDESKKAMIHNFLGGDKISVYIDDLDRGWQGRKQDTHRISALLNAVRDLSTENRGICFRVSLRTEVYYLVRTSDESTDKIEGSVIWYSWINHQILVLLIKRIESYYGRAVIEGELIKKSQSDLAKFLNPIMDSRFSGKGHWENIPIYRVLMSLIRKRPRDLVKLCTLAGRHAYSSEHKKIGTNDLESIFQEYSQGRLQDTVNEYRSELPDIERLLLGMKPSKKEKRTSTNYVYTTADLLKKVKTIQERGEFKFSNDKKATTKELAAFMYKINFLTARREEKEGIVRKYFEENRYLSNQFSDFGFDWEVHPAYRWALQPESETDIFLKLEPTLN